MGIMNQYRNESTVSHRELVQMINEQSLVINQQTAKINEQIERNMDEQTLLIYEQSLVSNE